MTLHLIKLSVGPDSLTDLADWQQRRLREQKRDGQKPELIHITRHMPKRAGELLDGGSIYWVISGWLCARQRLLEFRPLTRDGVPHCGIIYDPELIRIRPRQHRPFQGWRYLAAGDAPPDLPKNTPEADIPEPMRHELTKLGLI